MAANATISADNVPIISGHHIEQHQGTILEGGSTTSNTHSIRVVAEVHPPPISQLSVVSDKVSPPLDSVVLTSSVCDVLSVNMLENIMSTFVDSPVSSKTLRTPPLMLLNSPLKSQRTRMILSP